MLKAPLIVLCLFLLASLAEATDPLRFVVPLNGSRFDDHRLHAVVEADIDINGQLFVSVKETGYRAELTLMELPEPRVRVWHAVLTLGLGLNTIMVLDEGGKELARVQSYHFNQYKMKEPDEKFTKQIFHSSYIMETCDNCHNLDPYQTGDRGCFSVCHAKTIRGRKYEHGPVGQDNCIACHDPDGRDSGYQVILPDGKICYSCHIMRKDTERYVHGAVAEKRCTGCHDAHGSEHEYQLKEAVNKVCFNCHPNMSMRYEDSPYEVMKTKDQFIYQDQPNFEVEHRHPPVVEGHCAKCHDPHSSNHETAHLRKKLVNLCKNEDCHAPIWSKIKSHWHPYDKRPGAGAPVRLPDNVKLDEEAKNIVCFTCHNPHGSPNQKMFREPKAQLCKYCHTNVKEAKY